LKGFKNSIDTVVSIVLGLVLGAENTLVNFTHWLLDREKDVHVQNMIIFGRPNAKLKLLTSNENIEVKKI
jgi:hypothetical protein